MTNQNNFFTLQIVCSSKESYKNQIIQLTFLIIGS